MSCPPLPIVQQYLAWQPLRTVCVCGVLCLFARFAFLLYYLLFNEYLCVWLKGFFLCVCVCVCLFSRTPLGRARAWLRLALMQKRLADYLRLLITRKDLLRYAHMH